MANYKKKWQPKQNSGAKKGLEKKMAYWENKDFQYEFGVTLGMCMNLAVESGVDPTNEEEFLKKTFEIFKAVTKAKSHKKFINHFVEYYSKKKDAKELLKDK